MLRLPDMIRLLADQNLAPLADAMIDDPNQRRWLLARTGKRLGLDNRDRSGVAVASVMPGFFRRRRDFTGSCRHPSLDPSAVPGARPAGHSRRSRATLPALVAAERERPVILANRSRLPWSERSNCSPSLGPAHPTYELGRCLIPTSNSLIISAIRSARLAGLRLVASIQLR